MHTSQKVRDWHFRLCKFNNGLLIHLALPNVYLEATQMTENKKVLCRKVCEIDILINEMKLNLLQ